jgi:hypothetical protein
LSVGKFDSLWDRASAILHQGVDGMVGDRIRYRHNGVWLGDVTVAEDDRVIPGFILFDVENPNWSTERDETLGHKKQVKVGVRYVDHPARGDRIEHPKLGAGLYQPAGADPQNDGDYWIFDIQKVSA